MKNYVTLGLAAALTGSVAATLGYILGINQMEREMDRLVQKEIEEAKEYYQKLFKVGSYESPDILVSEEVVDEGQNFDPPKELMDAAIDAVKSYGGHILPAPVPVLPPQKKNVFEDGDAVFPDNETIEDNAPYVINVADFMEGDGYEKITVTWWDGDRTMADERDAIMDDVDKDIGYENLNKFGESDPADKNVVYIRNERLNVDYEVLFESGHYSVEVAGLQDEEPPVEKIRPRRRLAREE